MPLDSSTEIRINGIQCWDEGREELFNRTTSQVTRTIRCGWTDRAGLIGYLRGGANVIGVTTLYVNPQTAPDYPFLYVDQVTCVGQAGKNQGYSLDATSNAINYPYAVLTVTYTPITGLASGFISFDFGKDVFTMPQSTLKFADGNPVPSGVPLILPTVAITQGRLNLGTLPIATILAAAASPLDSSGLYGTATGTLLFDGGRAIRKFTTAGNENWDVEYRFLCRPARRWDYFYDVDGSLKQVKRNDGSPLFASSALSALFV